MHRRLIACALLAAALNAAVPAVESAFTSTTTTGPGRFAAAPAFVPRNLTPPAVSGDPAVGAALSATTGTWARNPQRFAYRWLRCAPSCAPIPGEDQSRYTVTGDDAGATLAVEVTAANDAGSATAVSARTAPVTRATYTHLLCADPATGAPVGSGGVLPDGLTFGTTNGVLPNPAPSARCDTRAPVVPLAGPSPVTPRLGDAGWLEYAAPAEVTVLGGQVYRQGSVPGGWAWSIGTADRCRPAEGCTERGEANDRFVAANRVTVGGPFRITLYCDAPVCDPDAGQVVRLFGARLTLQDTATPRLTATPTGSLATDPALSGTESITLGATDAGAGLYRLRATVDGTTVATRTVDGCTEVAPYAFAVRRPCPTALTAKTFSFDTTGWPRTGRLRVVLEDAGRNTTTVLNRPLG
jgi:hypothetical protein